MNKAYCQNCLLSYVSFTFTVYSPFLGADCQLSPLPWVPLVMFAVPIAALGLGQKKERPATSAVHPTLG